MRKGTITSMHDAAPANTYAQGPGNLLRVFTHDPLRRLLSATGRESSNVYRQPSWDLNIRPQDHTATNTYTRSYAYDKLGNIQKLKHVADGKANQDFVRNYEYGTGDNRLKTFTASGTAFENLYDPNGNLTKEGENRHYEWGANDKLAVFKNQAGSSTPSVYTNYFYNAQGERVKKHIRNGNKIVVTFYMDGGMFETSYVKPTGGSIDNNRFYNTIKVQDEGALIATIRVGNNVDDNTFAIKYIVGDHLNNSTAVLKTTGSLINREEYYPFGETSFGGFQYKRYRYNGKEKDEESGLYEYGARYYAPWLCRFISCDPMKEERAWLSPYNYVQNNPINLTDPTGALDDGGGGGDPPPIDSSLQGNPQSKNPTTEKTKVHNVKKGDTLSQIATDNNISVESLREANNLDPANDRKLQIGTELNIPATVQQITTDSNLSFSNSFNFLDSGLSFENSVSPKREEKGAIGYQFSLTLATPGGGYTIAFGYIGNANSENLFLSHGPAFGLEVSAAIEFFGVQSKEDFNPETDFAGTSYNLGGGGAFGGFVSGDATPAYPEDIVGRKYRVVGGGASIGLGGSYSKTNTITLKYPSKVMNPEKNPGHWMNGMKH